MSTCRATARRCRSRATLVREMLTHRMAREQAIERQAGEGPAEHLCADGHAVFAGASAAAPAAERNVLAHLLKLEDEGKVLRDGELWRAA